MRKDLVVIDIETEPDESALDHPPQFTAPANYKDPAKIEEWKAEKLESWKEGLALRASTGMIVAAGISSHLSCEPEIYHSEFHIEQESIELLIETLDHAHVDNLIVGGWNILEFDLPFIYQRAKIQRVPIPSRLFDPFDKWKPWKLRIADGMKIWAAGTKEYAGLDTVARVLRCGQKDNANSAKFGELYRSDRQAALDHLRNDLTMTRNVLEVLL